MSSRTSTPTYLSQWMRLTSGLWGVLYISAEGVLDASKSTPQTQKTIPCCSRQKIASRACPQSRRVYCGLNGTFVDMDVKVEACAGDMHELLGSMQEF
jgi:hypothetical protein